MLCFQLGLAVIFGLMGIVNFAHGALYHARARSWPGSCGFPSTWLAISLAGPTVIILDGRNFWGALIVAPLIVATFTLVLERTVIKRIYGLDPHLRQCC